MKSPVNGIDSAVRVDSGAQTHRRRKQSAQTIEELLDRELKATTVVQKERRSCRLSNLEASAASFADKVATGDVAAIKMAFELGIIDPAEPPLKIIFSSYEEEI